MIHELGVYRSRFERYRDLHLCPPGGSFRDTSTRPLVGAQSDTVAMDDSAPVDVEAATLGDCTLAERRATIGCYVVQEDGTVWIVYEACQHGIAEVTPIYTPKFDLMNETATANQAVTVEKGA